MLNIESVYRRFKMVIKSQKNGYKWLCTRGFRGTIPFVDFGLYK